MKKRLIILFLMAAVLLAACTQSKNTNIYKTEVNGQQFTVDTKQNTITHEGDLYRYESGQWPDGMRIIYPNGADYQNGKGSSNYDPERYVPGDTLIGVATNAENSKSAVKNPMKVFGNILLGILLCGVGVLNIFHPEFGWYLKLGWKFRDGEPSDLYLGLARFGGGVSALVGVIVILVAIFGS